MGLPGEAAVCLDDLLTGHAGYTLQAVDVLGEELEEQALVVQQLYKRVRDGRAVVARVEFLSECVEGLGVVAEEGDVEDGFCVGELQPREVGVEARLWGAKVWYAG